MPKLERILVPVDFSPCARVAVDHAIMLASRFGASVHLLHVIRPPTAYVGSEIMVDVSGQSRQSLRKFARNQATKEMKSFLEAITPPADVELESELKAGDPTRLVLQEAAEKAYDLIVMGTHGRTGLSHLLLGSVAEKVVRRAPCAVLTVRDEKLCPAPEEGS